MKKKKYLFLGLVLLSVLSILGIKTYANEANKPTKTNKVINYHYVAELGNEKLEATDFQAPKQFTVNHYVNSNGESYVLFMQEQYFNINVGFNFYPSDHYYPFEKFTEVMEEPRNDLSSDDPFVVDENYSGPTTVNYYYTAELAGNVINTEPRQLSVNHYVNSNGDDNLLFMQETYFNTDDNFMFYPSDHYYPFGKFTEEMMEPQNDLLSDDAFWVREK